MARTRSPHDCPYCGSDDALFSRPVEECGFLDTFAASNDYEYKCWSCDWEGYGPGPDADNPTLGRFDRALFRARKTVTSTVTGVLGR